MTSRVSTRTSRVNEPVYNHEKLLIEQTIECIVTYNSNILTPTCHFDNFIITLKELQTNDSVFMSQIFYGYLRYNNLINNTLNILYHLKSSKVLRTDNKLYSIFIYLILIRLSQDLNINQLRSLILSQDSTRMLPLLEFLIDDEIIIVLRESWSTIFDIAYVDNNLIDNLKKYRNDITEMITYLNILSNSNSTTNVPEIEETKKTLTKPVPFKLSVPATHLLPEPEVIPRTIKANPIPETMYNTSLAEIEAKKKLRKEDIKNQTLANAAKQSSTFVFQSDSRPNNFEKVKAEILAERAKNYEPVKSNPIPEFSPIEPIRLNAAAILREDALYKKKMVKEAKALASYEAELHDSTDFYAWQEEVRLADENARLAEIDRRRLEMVASAQAAKDAMDNRREENLKIATTIKIETEKIKADKDAMLEVERLANIQNAIQLRKETEEAILLKKSQLAEVIQAKREQVVAESKVKLEQIKKLKEEELKKKKELISRIQVMEREANALAKKPKNFDSSTTAGKGFLEEMSLDELYDRLEMVQSEKEEQVRRNAEKIVAAKFEKQQSLQLKLDNISRIRAIGSEQASQRKTSTRENKIKETEAEKATRELAVVKMQSKLENEKEDKKKEAFRLAAELKQIKIERQFLNADKEMMEEKKLRELALGSERTLRETQESKIQESVKNNEIAAKERHRVLANKYKEQDETIKKQRNYDDKLEAMRELNEQQLKEQLEAKRLKTAAIAKYEKDSIEISKTHNPYATRIVENQTKMRTSALELAKSIIKK